MNPAAKPHPAARPAGRLLGLGIIPLLVGFPLAAVTTLALLPFWSWVEARFGVEAVGHSGPADWCYEIAYAAWVALIAGAMLQRRRAAARES